MVRSLFVILLAACGARDALDLAEQRGGDASTSGGAAGPGPSTSPSSPASSGTGGAPAPCTGFVVDGEPYPIPVGQNATEPEVGVAGDGRMFVAWLAQSETIDGDATIEIDAWPHPFQNISGIVDGPGPFVMGRGSPEPVVLFGDVFGGTSLAHGIFGTPGAFVHVPNGKPLYAVDIGSRTLYAVDEGGLLNVGSYATPNHASHGPYICLGTKMLASATRKGDGVVVAYADSIAPGQSCFAQTPQPGLSLVTMRYEIANPGDASFNLIEAAVLPQVEPLLHLELVATSFGAYAVYQTDGSTAVTMPPIQASLLDHGGELQPEGSGPIALTGSGIATNTIAATAMDEDVAVAWVDSIDPSAPTIIVRRLRADGSVVAETSIPTNAAWLSGKVRMVTSPDQRSLLLAWTADVNKSVGVAKVMCTP